MQVVLQSAFEVGFSTWEYTGPVFVELQLQWVGEGFQSGDPLLHTQATWLEVMMWEFRPGKSMLVGSSPNPHRSNMMDKEGTWKTSV